MLDEILPYFIITAWALIATYFTVHRGGFTRLAPALKSPPVSIFLPFTLAAFFLYLFIQGVLVPTAARHFICADKPVCTASNNLLTVVSDIAIVLGGLAVVLLSLLPAVRHRIWNDGNIAYKLLRGARWWLFIYPVAVLFSGLIKLVLHLVTEYQPSTQVAVDFLTQLLDNPWLFYFNAFLVSVVVPLSEEVLFRGFFYNMLKGFLPIRLSMVLSALCFSLFHFDMAQGITNIELISVIFLLGLVLAWLYERGNSLWPSVGLHATFNFVSIIGILLE